MLAPRASSAFVCMRCELRLSRPRLPALSRTTSHATFSTSACRRDADDEGPQIQEHRPHSQLSEYPLGRVRRRKGRALRETTARLGGVKTLGADAEILVLKEVGETRPEQQSATPETVAESPQAINILASLQQESKPVTPEEINKQLESLRPITHTDPEEPHYISQSTFIRLVRLLTEGFTQQQLSHYYSSTRGVQQDRVQKEVLDSLRSPEGTAKKPIKRTEWHPGTTQITRRLPGLDINHRSKRKPVSKQLLVDQILRDVWKLVLLEEIEAPGEIELSLKPWQLTLLNVGANPTILDQIGMERKAKIEIHWPHNALRITADKNTAEYAANDVEEILQRTETQRLYLAPWTSSMEDSKVPKKPVVIFPQKLLNEVASISRTWVQAVSDHTLMIRGLDKFSVSLAERYLIKALPLKTDLSRSIDAEALNPIKDGGYLLPTAFAKESLDPRYRDQNLGRWTLPIARLPDDTEAPSAVHTTQTDPASVTSVSPDHRSEHQQARVLSTITTSPKTYIDPSHISPGQRKTGHWALQPDNQISALFGQVLFPLNSVRSDVDSVDILSSESTFSRNFPAISRLATDDAFQILSETTALHYEFVPAPEQTNFRKDQIFPTLYIQFRRGRYGKPSLRRVSIGFNKQCHDVLLPGKAVDIRFNRQDKLRLNKPGEDKNIKEFADAVCANIESGERLTAPPSLQLDIPKWTLPGFDSNATGTRTVTYLFAGIRFRHSVAASFMDTNVAYSTVNSGKFGRRGGALTAYYNHDAGYGNEQRETEPQTSHDEKLKRFIQNCFGIADRITEATAQTQTISKLLRPRSEMSARKLRRQEALDQSSLEGLDDASVEGMQGQTEADELAAASEVKHANSSVHVASGSMQVEDTEPELKEQIKKDSGIQDSHTPSPPIKSKTQPHATQDIAASVEEDPHPPNPFSKDTSTPYEESSSSTTAQTLKST